MKLRQALAAAIAAEGVTTVFGLIGDGNMYLLEDLKDRHGTRFVNARAETAGLLMADGYARAGGGIGVATVTHGPGLAAAAVGMGVAVAAQTPMLVVVGDVTRRDPLHVQALDQETFGKACGMAVFSVRTSHGALATVQRAFQHIRLGRGPALLSVAVDVQEEEVEETYVSSLGLAAKPGALIAAERELRELARLISGARRPVLLAGRGARGAVPWLESLAEKANALLGTTIPSRGLFEGNKRNLGVIGGLSEPGTKALLAEADVIVAFGAGLNRYTVHYGDLAPKAKFALVTTGGLIGSPMADLVQIVQGEASDVAERLCAMAKSPTSEWSLTAVSAALVDPLADLPAMLPSGLDPRAVVRAVNRSFPKDRLEVLGIGHFAGWPGMHSQIGRGGQFINPWDFGSIGVGLPEAIGAAFARPDLPVVAWEGDGSLLWGMGEVETLARTGARVTLMVLDDCGYGAEVRKLGLAGRGIDQVQFPPRDLAAAATALGLPSFLATDEASLEAAVGEAARAKGPVMIQARIAPDKFQEVF
jgi:acetolactate synthase-1/2/3 large subunit